MPPLRRQDLQAMLRQAVLWLAVLCLFLLSACQAGSGLLPTPTALPPAPPPTATPAIPTPTLPPTAAPSPDPTSAPTPGPSATWTPAVLSSQGPWLAYLAQAAQPMAGLPYEIMLLDQDGSGRTTIQISGCDSGAPVAIEETSASRLVRLGEAVFLIQPERKTGQLIYHPSWPACGTAFSGGTEAGLLAAAGLWPGTSGPDLRLYEVPEGSVRAYLPLDQCTGADPACGPADRAAPPMVWSPDGQFLAYSLELDGGRSALNVCETAANECRPLVTLDGWISQIWWSPGASWVILGASAIPGDPFTTALWAMPSSGGEARLLSALEQPFPQGVLGWLDENRFLIYDGSLARIVDEGAFNLRLVDLRAGQVTALFADGFVAAALDRASGTVGLSVTAYNSLYPDGLWLVSLADPSSRSIRTSASDRLAWDEGLGLFLTGEPCPGGEPGQQAFDRAGAWQCAQLPSSDTFPSPDGRWRAVLREGLWLEAAAKKPLQVNEAAPTQVIWQPDSRGLFFAADQALYHVRLADLAVQKIADLSVKDQLPYQWID